MDFNRLMRNQTLTTNKFRSNQMSNTPMNKSLS